MSCAQLVGGLALAGPESTTVRPAECHGPGQQVVGGDLLRRLGPPLRRLLLEGLDLLEQRRHAVGQPEPAGTRRAAATCGEELLFLADQVERGLAGQRRDPPGAGRDRLLADDLEQADLADVVQMRAAAELAGEVAHPNDADVLRVLLAEEGHRARASSPRRWASRSSSPASRFEDAGC